MEHARRTNLRQRPRPLQGGGGTANSVTEHTPASAKLGAARIRTPGTPRKCRRPSSRLSPTGGLGGRPTLTARLSRPPLSMGMPLPLMCRSMNITTRVLPPPRAAPTMAMAKAAMAPKSAAHAATLATIAAAAAATPEKWARTRATQRPVPGRSCHDYYAARGHRQRRRRPPRRNRRQAAAPNGSSQATITEVLAAGAANAVKPPPLATSSSDGCADTGTPNLSKSPRLSARRSTASPLWPNTMANAGRNLSMTPTRATLPSSRATSPPRRTYHNPASWC